MTASRWSAGCLLRTAILAAGAWLSAAPGHGEDAPTVAIVEAAHGETVVMERMHKSDEEWRRQLTPEQYHVTREQGTEPAFTGRYWNHHDSGVYRCVACGIDLYASDAKFDSGTGWPSFWAAVAAGNLRLVPDESHGMRRTEIRCARCDAHLGHLFEDGPAPTGQRHCINSCALTFAPRKPSAP